MNLGDPELEFIDPTPNVQSLFISFDKQFFWTKLVSRSAVRWSKRMYSCAGTCTYDQGGFCDIALSEPLLKLRPRKDLIETLLHEMIHAFLFVTHQDRDGRDGHGPIFQAHMHRINRCTGLNISIYHNFYDEVELYQTHWWRCNGRCQTMRPNFGIVRRSMNIPPGPKDYWWFAHIRKCGGTFIKIKEPEKKGKKSNNPVVNQKNVITNYINNNSNIVNNNVPLASPKPVLKDLKNLPVTSATISNENKMVIVTQNGLVNPKVDKPFVLFSGKGQTLNGGRQRTNSDGVLQSVRNIWSNKQLPANQLNNRQNTAKEQVKINSNTEIKAIKHKTESVYENSPPAKVKKISDYFNSTGTAILKDLYGQDFKIVQPDVNKKLVAVAIKSELVDCPICTIKVSNEEINRHLDDCLNKEVIDDSSKNNSEQRTDKFVNPVDIVKHSDSPSKKLPDMCSDYLWNSREMIKQIANQNILNTAMVMAAETTSIATEKTNSATDFDSNDVNKVKLIVKKINYDKQVRISGNFIQPKTENVESVDVGYPSSFLENSASKVKNAPVKIEPGTSKDIVSQITDQFCACCPICTIKVSNEEINRHLDECLNKEVIDDLTKHNSEQRTDKFVNPVDIVKHSDSPSKKLPDKCSDYLWNSREMIKQIANQNILNTAMVMAAETTSIATENTNSATDFDPNDVNKVKLIVKKINYDKQVRISGNFILPKTENVEKVDVGFLPSFLDDSASKVKNPPVKIEPGTSKDIVSQITDQFCACCGNKLDKQLEEHLDECLAFYNNNRTIPEDRASTSFADQTIVIDDDDDIFDETLTMNATGTKYLCPCCLEMIEEADMNVHLDQCLS